MPVGEEGSGRLRGFLDLPKAGGPGRVTMGVDFDFNFFVILTLSLLVEFSSNQTRNQQSSCEGLDA